MRSLSALIPVALLCTLAGCGAAQPKRAVDSRTEVLRFYPPDTGAVVLMRTDLSSGDQAALAGAAAGIPEWQRLQPRLGSLLHANGLSGEALRPSLRPDDESPSPPQLAIGAASLRQAASGRSLVVLATDHADRMDRLFGEAAAAHRLSPAGTYHDARLFK